MVLSQNAIYASTFVELSDTLRYIMIKFCDISQDLRCFPVKKIHRTNPLSFSVFKVFDLYLKEAETEDS